MIGAFENTKPDIVLPKKVKVGSDYTEITSLFLLNSTYRFSTLSDFINQSVWKQGISAGSIIPFHNCRNSDIEGEETIYERSALGYMYKLRNGKKAILLKYDMDIEYFKDVEQYALQYHKVCFADYSGNIYGRLNGSLYDGFDVDLIDVRPIKFGTGSDHSWVELYIELSSADEWLTAVVKKPTWYANDLRSIGVTISAITHPNTDEIRFKVQYSDPYNECTLNIDTLTASDFSITDEVNGTLNIDTFTNVGAGVYLINWDNMLYTGTIVISSDDYNGSGAYDRSSPDFSPVDFDNTDFVTS